MSGRGVLASAWAAAPATGVDVASGTGVVTDAVIGTGAVAVSGAVVGMGAVAVSDAGSTDSLQALGSQFLSGEPVGFAWLAAEKAASGATTAAADVVAAVAVAGVAAADGS